MPPPVPVIEVSHHRDPHGIGRPYGKAYPRNAASRLQVGPHFPINLIMGSRSKFPQIRGIIFRNKAIGILDLFLPSVLIHNSQTVCELPPLRHKTCEKSVFVRFLHLDGSFLWKNQCLHPLRSRDKRLNQHPACHRMGAQNRMWIFRFRIYNFLHSTPIHQIIQVLFHCRTSTQKMSKKSVALNALFFQ